MNIQRSFSHTDLALELKDELEESLEEQQAFDGIKIQQERIGERGLQETVRLTVRRGRNSLENHGESM